MNEIEKQVARAGKRLNLRTFLKLAGRCLFVSLLVSMIAISIPKLMAFDFLSGPGAADIWNWSWIGGSIAMGLLAAATGAWYCRADPVETAIHVDREFGLKERVSSVMALDDRERQTEFGKALVEDTAARVRKIDVSEKFKLKFSWRALIPVCMACCAFAVAFGIRNAQTESVEASSLTPAQEQRLKEAKESLQKSLEEQLKESDDEELRKAELEFRELMGKASDPKDKQATKKVMAKLNNIKQQLEKRQREIGDSEAMKKQLKSMKGIGQGAADKVASSLKAGEFKKAKEEVDKLAKKLANGELSEKEREQLAKQMKQMADALDKVARENEKKQQELKQEIEQAKSEGNLDKAAQMQNELESMEKQQQQMEQMQNLAQKMGDCADCMKSGDKQKMAEAQQALKEMSEQLEQMQTENDALESMQDTMNQIDEMKNAMSGGDCEGEQCDGTQMLGGGDGDGDGEGNGMGKGQGGGERPENENPTGFFDSKVEGQVKPGEAIISGKVDGPNEAGTSRTETREQIESSLSEESDPLTDIRLPRSQREHAKEYFEKIREGN